MGNRVPCVSAELHHNISTQQIWAKLAFDSDNCIPINMGTVSDHAQGCSFRIKIAGDMNHGKQYAIILFPHHPDHDKKILDTQRYSQEDLSRELNARYHAGNDDTQRRLVIIYGDTIYKVRNIDGHIYLVWAEAVSRVVPNKPKDCITVKECPMLIETNKHLSCTHYFPILGWVDREIIQQLSRSCIIGHRISKVSPNFPVKGAKLMPLDRPRAKGNHRHARSTKQVDSDVYEAGVSSAAIEPVGINMDAIQWDSETEEEEEIKEKGNSNALL